MLNDLKQEIKYSIWKRIILKIFPQKYIDYPELDSEINPEDNINVNVKINLCWLDVIKILISRKIIVTTKISTQYYVGQTKSVSNINILPP